MRARLRRFGLAIGCALLVFAVLSGVAQAGQRYFFCVPMGLLASNPCLHSGTHADEKPRAEVRAHHFDCCEVLTMPHVPDGAHLDPPAVPDAPLIAVVPPAAQGEQRRAAGPPFRAPRSVERWRVPLPSPSEQRARLMVFLT